MRNIWKGLIVGALTGAGIGAIVDFFTQGAHLIQIAGQKAVEAAPGAADRVKDTASFAKKKAADITPEVAAHVKSAIPAASKKVSDAAVMSRVRGAVSEMISDAHDVPSTDYLRRLIRRVDVSEQADHAREAMAHAAGKERALASRR